MSDEPIKRGPGRPRKVKPEETQAAPEVKATPKYKMKAKPNWEDLEGIPAEDSPDRLRIDPSLIPEGMSLQWVTHTVFGKEVPQRRATFERKGWTPVHQEDFDGIFDGMFMPKGAPGEIELEGLILMARPKALTEKAKYLDQRAAREQIAIKEQALRGGELPGVSLATQHPSALNANRIGRSMERMEFIRVPEK